MAVADGLSASQREDGQGRLICSQRIRTEVRWLLNSTSHILSCSVDAFDMKPHGQAQRYYVWQCDKYELQ